MELKDAEIARVLELLEPILNKAAVESATIIGKVYNSGRRNVDTDKVGRKSAIDIIDLISTVAILSYIKALESNKTEQLLQELDDLTTDFIYKEPHSPVDPDCFRVNNFWGSAFVPEVIILKPISEGFTASLEMAVRELTKKKKKVMAKDAKRLKKIIG